MVQLGKLAKTRTGRAELFAKTGVNDRTILADQARSREDDARDERS
jgi:hypothetical protein